MSTDTSEQPATPTTGDAGEQLQLLADFTAALAATAASVAATAASLAATAEQLDRAIEARATELTTARVRAAQAEYADRLERLHDELDKAKADVVRLLRQLAVQEGLYNAAVQVLHQHGLASALRPAGES